MRGTWCQHGVTEKYFWIDQWSFYKVNVKLRKKNCLLTTIYAFRMGAWALLTFSGTRGEFTRNWWLRVIVWLSQNGLVNLLNLSGISILFKTWFESSRATLVLTKPALANVNIIFGKLWIVIQSVAEKLWYPLFVPLNVISVH